MNLVGRLAALEQRYGPYRPVRRAPVPEEPGIAEAEEAYLAALRAGRSPGACVAAAMHAYNTVRSVGARERLMAKLDDMAARRRMEDAP